MEGKATSLSADQPLNLSVSIEKLRKNPSPDNDAPGWPWNQVSSIPQQTTLKLPIHSGAYSSSTILQSYGMQPKDVLGQNIVTNTCIKDRSGKINGQDANIEQVNVSGDSSSQGDDMEQLDVSGEIRVQVNVHGTEGINKISTGHAEQNLSCIGGQNITKVCNQFIGRSKSTPPTKCLKESTVPKRCASVQVMDPAKALDKSFKEYLIKLSQLMPKGQHACESSNLVGHITEEALAEIRNWYRHENISSSDNHFKNKILDEESRSVLSEFDDHKQLVASVSSSPLKSDPQNMGSLNKAENNSPETTYSISDDGSDKSFCEIVEPNFDLEKQETSASKRKENLVISDVRTLSPQWDDKNKIMEAGRPIKKEPNPCFSPTASTSSECDSLIVALKEKQKFVRSTEAEALQKAVEILQKQVQSDLTGSSLSSLSAVPSLQPVVKLEPVDNNLESLTEAEKVKIEPEKGEGNNEDHVPRSMSVEKKKEICEKKLVIVLEDIKHMFNVGTFTANSIWNVKPVNTSNDNVNNFNQVSDDELPPVTDYLSVLNLVSNSKGKSRGRGRGRGKGVLRKIESEKQDLSDNENDKGSSVIKKARGRGQWRGRGGGRGRGRGAGTKNKVNADSSDSEDDATDSKSISDFKRGRGRRQGRSKGRTRGRGRQNKNRALSPETDETSELNKGDNKEKRVRGRGTSRVRGCGRGRGRGNGRPTSDLTTSAGSSVERNGENATNKRGRGRGRGKGRGKGRIVYGSQGSQSDNESYGGDNQTTKEGDKESGEESEAEESEDVSPKEIIEDNISEGSSRDEPSETLKNSIDSDSKVESVYEQSETQNSKHGLDSMSENCETGQGYPKLINKQVNEASTFSSENITAVNLTKNKCSSNFKMQSNECKTIDSIKSDNKSINEFLIGDQNTATNLSANLNVELPIIKTNTRKSMETNSGEDLNSKEVPDKSTDSIRSSKSERSSIFNLFEPQKFKLTDSAEKGSKGEINNNLKSDGRLSNVSNIETNKTIEQGNDREVSTNLVPFKKRKPVLYPSNMNMDTMNISSSVKNFGKKMKPMKTSSDNSFQSSGLKHKLSELTDSAQPPPKQKLSLTDYQKKRTHNGFNINNQGMLTCSLSEEKYKQEKDKIDYEITKIKKKIGDLEKQNLKIDPRLTSLEEKLSTDLILKELEKEMVIFEYHTEGLCMQYGELGKKLGDEYLLHSEKLTMHSEENVKLILTRKIPQKGREKLLKVKSDLQEAYSEWENCLFPKRKFQLQKQIDKLHSHRKRLLLLFCETAKGNTVKANCREKLKRYRKIEDKLNNRPNEERKKNFVRMKIRETTAQLEVWNQIPLLDEDDDQTVQIKDVSSSLWNEFDSVLSKEDEYMQVDSDDDSQVCYGEDEHERILKFSIDSIPLPPPVDVKSKSTIKPETKMVTSVSPSVVPISIPVSKGTDIAISSSPAQKEKSSKRSKVQCNVTSTKNKYLSKSSKNKMSSKNISFCKTSMDSKGVYRSVPQSIAAGLQPNNIKDTLSKILSTVTTLLSSGQQDSSKSKKPTSVPTGVPPVSAKTYSNDTKNGDVPLRVHQISASGQSKTVGAPSTLSKENVSKSPTLPISVTKVPSPVISTSSFQGYPSVAQGYIQGYQFLPQLSYLIPPVHNPMEVLPVAPKKPALLSTPASIGGGVHELISNSNQAQSSPSFVSVFSEKLEMPVSGGFPRTESLNLVSSQSFVKQKLGNMLDRSTVTNTTITSVISSPVMRSEFCETIPTSTTHFELNNPGLENELVLTGDKQLDNIQSEFEFKSNSEQKDVINSTLTKPNKCETLHMLDVDEKNANGIAKDVSEFNAAGSKLDGISLVKREVSDESTTKEEVPSVKRKTDVDLICDVVMDQSPLSPVERTDQLDKMKQEGEKGSIGPDQPWKIDSYNIGKIVPLSPQEKSGNESREIPLNRSSIESFDIEMKDQATICESVSNTILTETDIISCGSDEIDQSPLSPSVDARSSNIAKQDAEEISSHPLVYHEKESSTKNQSDYHKHLDAISIPLEIIPLEVPQPSKPEEDFVKSENVINTSVISAKKWVLYEVDCRGKEHISVEQRKRYAHIARIKNKLRTVEKELGKIKAKRSSQDRNEDPITETEVEMKKEEPNTKTDLLVEDAEISEGAKVNNVDSIVTSPQKKKQTAFDFLYDIYCNNDGMPTDDRYKEQDDEKEMSYGNSITDTNNDNIKIQQHFNDSISKTYLEPEECVLPDHGKLGTQTPNKTQEEVKKGQGITKDLEVRSSPSKTKVSNSPSKKDVARTPKSSKKKAILKKPRTASSKKVKGESPTQQVFPTHDPAIKKVTTTQGNRTIVEFVSTSDGKLIREIVTYNKPNRGEQSKKTKANERTAIPRGVQHNEMIENTGSMCSPMFDIQEDAEALLQNFNVSQLDPTLIESSEPFLRNLQQVLNAYFHKLPTDDDSLEGISNFEQRNVSYGASDQSYGDNITHEKNQDNFRGENFTFIPNTKVRQNFSNGNRRQNARYRPNRNNNVPKYRGFRTNLMKMSYLNKYKPSIYSARGQHSGRSGRTFHQKHKEIFGNKNVDFANCTYVPHYNRNIPSSERESESVNRSTGNTFHQERMNNNQGRSRARTSRSRFRGRNMTNFSHRVNQGSSYREKAYIHERPSFSKRNTSLSENMRDEMLGFSFPNNFEDEIRGDPSFTNFESSHSKPQNDYNWNEGTTQYNSTTEENDADTYRELFQKGLDVFSSGEISGSIDEIASQVEAFVAEQRRQQMESNLQEHSFNYNETSSQSNGSIPSFGTGMEKGRAERQQIKKYGILEADPCQQGNIFQSEIREPVSDTKRTIHENLEFLAKVLEDRATASVEEPPRYRHKKHDKVSEDSNSSKSPQKKDNRSKEKPKDKSKQITIKSVVKVGVPMSKIDSTEVEDKKDGKTENINFSDSSAISMIKLYDSDSEENIQKNKQQKNEKKSSESREVEHSKNHTRERERETSRRLSSSSEKERKRTRSERSSSYGSSTNKRRVVLLQDDNLRVQASSGRSAPRSESRSSDHHSDQPKYPWEEDTRKHDTVHGHEKSREEGRRHHSGSERKLGHHSKYSHHRYRAYDVKHYYKYDARRFIIGSRRSLEKRHISGSSSRSKDKRDSSRGSREKYSQSLKDITSRSRKPSDKEPKRGHKEDKGQHVNSADHSTKIPKKDERETYSKEMEKVSKK